MKTFSYLATVLVAAMMSAISNQTIIRHTFANLLQSKVEPDLVLH
jgi:hypothetical protein